MVATGLALTPPVTSKALLVEPTPVKVAAGCVATPVTAKAVRPVPALIVAAVASAPPVTIRAVPVLATGVAPAPVTLRAVPVPEEPLTSRALPALIP